MISKRCLITNKSSSYAYRLGCRCDLCKKDHNDRRTDADKLKARELSKLWRLKNINKSREMSKQYQLKNPDKVFGWQLKKYGLTPFDYRVLETKQCGVCAICFQEEQNTHQFARLSVDHCHNTKKVRGLLCSHCNTGLGKFKHSINILEKAITYLKEKENGTI